VDQSASEYAASTIALTVNTWYSIVVEYYENGGSASMQLDIPPPARHRKQIIPGKLSNTLCNNGFTPTKTPRPWSAPPPRPSPRRPHPAVYQGFPIPPGSTTSSTSLPRADARASGFYTGQAIHHATDADIPKTRPLRIVLAMDVSHTSMANNEVSARPASAIGRIATREAITCLERPSNAVMQLPAMSRPSNLSTTYFWYVTATGAACPVPYTERFDAWATRAIRLPRRGQHQHGQHAEEQLQLVLQEHRRFQSYQQPDYEADTPFLARPPSPLCDDNVH